MRKAFNICLQNKIINVYQAYYKNVITVYMCILHTKIIIIDLHCQVYSILSVIVPVLRNSAKVN